MSITPPRRIGGWLLVPLAWLLMSLLSTALAVVFYVMLLLSPQAHHILSTQPGSQVALWYVSVVCAVTLFTYSLWLTVAFFKRRHKVRKHYIVWLLCCVLLAIKAFAFAPVNDALALRQLLFPLLAAAVLAPYFQRSARVKQTFINP